MSTRSHFIVKSAAISGASCGLCLTLLGLPLWLIGVSGWLGAGGVVLGLMSGAVVAVERRRR
jgi:hypothetical protein